MKRGVLLILVSILIPHYALAEQTTYNAEKAEIKNDLSLEYTEKLGLKRAQILDIEIVNDSTLKVYINECSFCGAFGNPKMRDDVARKTLDWFLNKSGQKKGTVEWHNKSKAKIMSISGSPSEAEIKLGSSCSIR